MNNLFKSLGILLVITIFYSCEEKPTPPVLSTNTITEISTSSAISGGNITDDGGAPIISKGVCWNTTDNPTIDNNKTTESGESLSFTSNISQLIPSTSYYVRAYAVNSAGTSYGKSVSFKTLGDKPASSSQSASNIQLTSATLNGTVNPNYLSTEVTFEFGLTTSYGSTSAAQQSPLSGSTDTNVSADITELSPGSTYHFRIKAENSIGITYSSDMTFTTLGSVPATTVETANNIQVNSATLNGSVNPNHLSTEVTFEYGLTESYGSTLAAQQSPVSGSTDTNVSADITELSPGSTYHFRIKAENSIGITHSSDMTFTTLGSVPATTVETATNIQVNSATLNGSVNPNHLSTDVTFEWGITTDYGNTNTALLSPLTGSSIINVSSDLTGLAPGTIYHFRIVSTNELGTTNSDDLTFSTLGQIPTATTQNATILQINSVTLNSSVNPNYLSTIVSFEWGTSNSYGNTITVQSPITGSSTLNVSADLTGLTEETTYHFRIKAANELGTSYGEDMQFIISKPTLTSVSISNITLTSATSGGVNISDFGSTITEKGICWSISPSPSTSDNKQTSGPGLESFSAIISGLTPNTTYHLRAYAINNIGTGYGDELEFKTFAAIDANGNGYFQVIIGTQTWLTENLKTTKYNNGTAIPLVSNNTEWKNLTTPGYCWYNNDKETNGYIYGALYNWYTVNTGNVCPIGWHVPSYDEVSTLITYLEGVEVAGAKLKETGTTHWTPPNTESTNETGFTALPGGYRLPAGEFSSIWNEGYWWTTTETGSTNAWEWSMIYFHNAVDRVDYFKSVGNSIRCLKD